MPEEIIVSPAGQSLGDALGELLQNSSARSLAIASAFVSTSGVEETLKIVRRVRIREVRLVTGTAYAITHPEALRLSRDFGWSVRIARRGLGVFHPKLILAGERFGPTAQLTKVAAVYVGSGNLTGAAMFRNDECGFISDTAGGISGAARAFQHFWARSDPLTSEFLNAYSRAFAERNRRRAATDLEALGVSDVPVTNISAKRLATERPSRPPAMPTLSARVAWTGLESFTGEYRFQVEFPRAAGVVVRRLIGGHASNDGYVNVYCLDDRKMRAMQYRFYFDNSMFRLNVPNDVPNVGWARQHRSGIAVIAAFRRQNAPISFQIHRSGTAVADAVRRSAALGTWGRTSTRLYGWF